MRWILENIFMLVIELIKVNPMYDARNYDASGIKNNAKP